MAKFEIEIVTPEKKFFVGEVESINLTTLNGKVQILANHIPYVTGLVPGVIKIVQNGKEKVASLSGGFIQFANNKGIILADAAEWPQEIDVERANEAKKRAETRLQNKKNDHNVDISRAEFALKRAMARIQASSYNH
ncbi:ATP synthase F1 subunit epsilon [Clostridium cylindrosporum]|uniref:ATP synthase epsilon chain n=1 Tax=Clostridium cylindrosporum DSM 605 TaxID=1121307 RepID=A0A0J8DA98_CLOCY|nr:ATP synthase F1 subunit epsilon [Clostridium cylindrosporum]KMT22777.1 ATP synthase epsilon chain AtpC [Clostridium cylindrosporum DSM 605]